MVKIFYVCFLLMKYKREVNRISSMSTHFPPEIVEIYIHIIREKPQKKRIRVVVDKVKMTDKKQYITSIKKFKIRHFY